MSENHVGKVIQVTGPVLDIRFKEGELPDLHNAIEIMIDDRKLVAEVAQQVGDDVVRCVAMSSTDGLVRGVDAKDTGSPITVPVGDECLGRIFLLRGYQSIVKKLGNAMITDACYRMAFGQFKKFFPFIWFWKSTYTI